MWIEPETYRGRHSLNYGTQHESRYFVLEVDSPYTVPVIFKATVIAVIVTVGGFFRFPHRGQVCEVYALDTNADLSSILATRDLTFNPAKHIIRRTGNVLWLQLSKAIIPDF